MTDEGMPHAVRAASVADWLLARGRTSITTNEAAELLGIPAGQVRTRLLEPVRRNELVSPARGLWVPVPPQYRTWGAPPGLHIVDDLLGHLGREYYVGWLSAAEIHGSAHQRPQVFQVAVSRHVADRTVGRTRFDFAVRTDLGSLPRRRHEVPTGYAWVASPELVVLDLCADPERAAGLANAANVAAELAADDLVDVVELARVSRSFPAVVGRRAGWILDLVEADIETDVLVAAFRDRSTVPGVLQPDLPDRGPIDTRWGIRINEGVAPVQVDHDERRARLAEAVWRIVAREGVSAASVRGVVRETGLSMGSVRHFFSTQDELLRFAVTELVERVRRRIESTAAARAAAVDEGRPVEAAVALLEEILPLDDQRLTEARVWAAFTVPPVTDTDMAGIRNDADERIKQLCRDALTRLGEAGALHPDRDPDVETERVHALVDGLTVHLLVDPTAIAPARVRSLLVTHLSDLRSAPAAERDAWAAQARDDAERLRDEDPSTGQNAW